MNQWKVINMINIWIIEYKSKESPVFIIKKNITNIKIQKKKNKNINKIKKKLSILYI